MGPQKCVFRCILVLGITVCVYTLYMVSKTTHRHSREDWTDDSTCYNCVASAVQEGRASDAVLHNYTLDNNADTPAEKMSSNSAGLSIWNGVQNLSNVVIDFGPKKDAHHVYSAYYDARPLPYRPAVIMFGYVRRKSSYPIYCYFRYDDNITSCLKQTVAQIPLIGSNVWPESYFCKVKSGDRIPSHVMLSAESTCDLGKWSNPIPVLNRASTQPKDKIGVCVEGGIWTTDGDNERIFRLALEFLAMVKTLGASVVTMYSVNIEQAILERILFLYPGFVEILNWENLNNTLHMYGQRVLLNDCIYRNMYRVKYLALIDLDEMIYPVSTKTWPDMLQVLEKKGNYAGYTFSNNFIEEVDRTTSRSCTHLNSVKYFERLKRLPWPSFKKNTKMKMIVRPDLVSASCIHDLCKATVKGYTKTYWVPSSVGIMAHYRVPVPLWYVYGKGVEDRTALRFQDQVMQEIRRTCFMLANSYSKDQNHTSKI